MAASPRQKRFRVYLKGLFACVVLAEDEASAIDAARALIEVRAYSAGAAQ